MDIEVRCNTIAGTVQAIASKSDVHRALICAALADRNSRVCFSASSQDIAATIGCLNSLGAAITADAQGAQVVPAVPKTEKIILDCGESGSTLRFLLPVAAASGASCVFRGHGRLPERPLEPLVTLMREHGVSVSAPPDSICEISGRMRGGRFQIPGNVSSQFITGLLLALPLAGGGEIEVLPPVESRGYIDMTVNTMRRFGVRVQCEGNTYSVGAARHYTARTEQYLADGDWSNAAFFLSAAAIGGEVTAERLSAASLQGDRAIAALLATFGADVQIQPERVTVRARNLRGIEIDAAQIPDLVPVLAAVAAFAEGDTIIRNAARLRLKESDRLTAVRTALTAVGASVAELADGLVIRGDPAAVYSGTANSFGDHRIAMALAVTAMRGGRIQIQNAQAVEKSYPRFYDDFQKLGGICNVVQLR